MSKEKPKSERVQEAVWIERFRCKCGKDVTVAFNLHSLEYRVEHVKRIQKLVDEGKFKKSEEIKVTVTKSEEVKT
jgi:hypothetical protein